MVPVLILPQQHQRQGHYGVTLHLSEVTGLCVNKHFLGLKGAQSLHSDFLHQPTGRRDGRGGRWRQMAHLLLIKPHSLCTLGMQETGQTRPSEGAPGCSRPSLERTCPCPQGAGSQAPCAGPAPRGRRGFHMGSSPLKHPEVGSQAV